MTFHSWLPARYNLSHVSMLDAEGATLIGETPGRKLYRAEVLSETKTRQALCWKRSEIKWILSKQLHFAIHHWGTTPVFLHSASGLR